MVFPADGKAFQPELLPGHLATLSDGRLAFFNSTEKIEVLDITTGTPVATIDIAHDNDVLGIALEGSNLTWIQQPVAEVLGPPTTNPSLPTCEFGDLPYGPRDRRERESHRSRQYPDHRRQLTYAGRMHRKNTPAMSSPHQMPGVSLRLTRRACS